MNILSEVTHRPWPVLRGPWLMTQTWHDLLFAHWPVPPGSIEPLLPAGVQVDIYDGQAWVGIVAFRLSGIRLHGLPEISAFSNFPEVNVRTYVTAGGKPGVCFLSLDADNLLVTLVARPWFHLAYHNARISFHKEGGSVYFSGRRRESSEITEGFAAHYGPCSPPCAAHPGTLEHWLTERYCYYARGRGPRLYRCEIHHPPWQLQRASADIRENTMALYHGIQLPETEPLLHYARYMKALIWQPRRIA